MIGRIGVASAHVVCLAVILLAGAGAPAAGEDEILRSAGPNPNAPAELRQFAFLVGDWEARAYRIDEAGKEVEFGYADWRVGYILDGYAIQDAWIYRDLAAGTEEYGTMFRTFNPEAGEWRMVEQRHTDLEFVQMTAKQVGETMEMYGVMEFPQGKINFRRVFYNIEQDRFEWRTDFSRDGGKTWQEGAFYLRATRKK